MKRLKQVTTFSLLTTVLISTCLGQEMSIDELLASWQLQKDLVKSTRVEGWYLFYINTEQVVDGRHAFTYYPSETCGQLNVGMAHEHRVAIWGGDDNEWNSNVVDSVVQLKDLISLSCYDERMRDEDLKRLANIKKLKVLNITSWRISDRGIHAVGALKSLRTLAGLDMPRSTKTTLAHSHRFTPTRFGPRMVSAPTHWTSSLRDRSSGPFGDARASSYRPAGRRLQFVS